GGLSDAAMKTALESAFDNGTTMNEAETLWQMDFNGDGTIAGIPIGGGGGTGQTFIADATHHTYAGTAAGNDTVDYHQNATSGVTVDLKITTAQSVGGGLGSETLTSIENLTGSNFGDHLTGTTGVNLLT